MKNEELKWKTIIKKKNRNINIKLYFFKVKKKKVLHFFKFPIKMSRITTRSHAQLHSVCFTCTASPHIHNICSAALIWTLVLVIRGTFLWAPGIRYGWSRGRPQASSLANLPSHIHTPAAPQKQTALKQPLSYITHFHSSSCGKQNLISMRKTINTSHDLWRCASCARNMHSSSQQLWFI